jgi:hypothetical protein
MKRQKARILFWGSFLLLVVSGLILYFFWGESLLSQALFHLEDVMRDGTKARETILSYGYLAPLIFMILQILQVVFAPVPGEATGILGGYLFGAWPGPVLFIPVLPWLLVQPWPLSSDISLPMPFGADFQKQKFIASSIIWYLKGILSFPLFFFCFQVSRRIHLPTCWDLAPCLLRSSFL